MEKNLKEINILYKALVNSDDPESQRQILEIKRGAIKTKIEDILENPQDILIKEDNEEWVYANVHILVDYCTIPELD